MTQSQSNQVPRAFLQYTNTRSASHQADLPVNFDCKHVNELSDQEMQVLASLRERALTNFAEQTQDAFVMPKESAREELFRLPEGKELDDKLVLRAIAEDTVVAYCHVLCGWPRANEWTIEQLLLDPEHRLKGIGSLLIKQIERLAETAEVRATQILSVPSRPRSSEFWSTIGYEDQTDELKDTVQDTYGYMTIMRKKLI